MPANPLRDLEACGQSVWLDSISRETIRSGTLQHLISEDGLSGVTANPTIFEKAIAGTHDYDDTIREIAAKGSDPMAIYEALAIEDVGAAADILRATYDRCGGKDGFVSIEVSPDLAADTEGSVQEARRFWSELNRPNVFIKIPATPEGIPAIEQLISEGINVNITLIFAVAVYEQVMDAYLSGLEQRVERGQEISQIASVASFFVSRVDTLVDKRLEERSKVSGEHVEDLAGKAAVANARIAYERFEQVFGSERFQRLAAQGGQIQRPLWASTSTKNPNYPDTMYVDDLVGKETVNTMPLQTIQAVRDHGHIRCDAVKQDLKGAHQLMDRLSAAGIDMKAVTDQLTREGVKLFADSLESLYETIRQKSALIVAGKVSHEKASLDGQQSSVDSALAQMSSGDFMQRLWNKDPALWKPNPADQNEITDRLGWLHVSDCMLENKQRFRDIADYVRDRDFTHAVVLGMGGSSLAPYVLAESFGRQAGYPEMLVLDSTDPEAILDVERRIDLEKTLFLVSTKSGTTTETLSFFATFWEKVQGRRGDAAGEQFVAITDPGTPLQDLAKERGFHACFLNPADIGGRYSAMSYFGMVPAAVMGLDVEKLLDRAQCMEQACAQSVPPRENPGAWLGTIMGTLARAGRDKVTFFLSPGIETLGLWLEQLLAESTGKEGKGLVPVPDNPPGAPDVYADDHLFVCIDLAGASGDVEQQAAVLERAGQPIVHLGMEDLYDLATEFFRWEFATAVAGALLGINAFDQPNVQESKDNTKRLLGEYQRSGSLPEPAPLANEGGISIYANDGGRSRVGSENSVHGALSAFFSELKAPEYLAIMAYLAPTSQHDAELYPMRAELRDRRRVAVTLGYGPRFLHSTGQLHKGGPAEGVFLQVTAETSQDVPVPGEGYSYETLIGAQALGDFQSLQQHGRPAIRIHLPDESNGSLQRMRDLVQRALQSQASTVR